MPDSKAARGGSDSTGWGRTMGTRTVLASDTNLDGQVIEQFEGASQQAAAFEVLSHERRRLTVQILLSHSGDEVTVRELTRQVAANENGLAPTDVTGPQRKRVYTALTQSHLPNLAEHGFVIYDDERNVVRATERVSDLQLYLNMRSQGEFPWAVYYAGLGGIGLTIVASKAIGLFPIAEVPALGWAAALACLLLVSGIVHTVSR